MVATALRIAELEGSFGSVHDVTGQGRLNAFQYPQGATLAAITYAARQE